MRKYLLILIFFFATTGVVHANVLSQVSDLLSTSAPGSPANHTIQFTVPHTIPPSGTIVVKFQSGAFTIPSGFDYTDVDFAVWDGSVYVDRPLAAVSDATNDGVAVVSGSSGVITVSLSSTSGIPAGSQVQLRLGLHAVFGDVPQSAISNPSLVKSYSISLVTTDDSGIQLDYGTAMIAVVSPVTLNVPLKNVAPIPTNLRPGGELAAGTRSIELTLETDRTSTCKYSLTPNTAYASMTQSFSPRQGTFFYTVLSGYTDGTSYNYYVRCVGTQGAVDTQDYPLSFSLKGTPISHTSVTLPGQIIGSGDVPNGSMVLYESSAQLSGLTSPLSSIKIVQDGKDLFTVQSGADGAFQAAITRLERGTYTFTMYSIDSKQRKSAPYSATMAIGAGTSNTISNIVLPPTLALEGDQVPIGSKIHVFGEATPNSVIAVTITPKPDTAHESKVYAATTSAAGIWDFATSAPKKGTYGVRARQKIASAESDFTNYAYIGVGQSPSVPASSASQSDINGDGKVNLIDFSILLSAWGTSKANCDLNNDGTVNLADFSILLFNWTG